MGVSNSDKPDPNSGLQPPPQAEQQPAGREDAAATAGGRETIPRGRPPVPSGKRRRQKLQLAEKKRAF